MERWKKFFESTGVDIWTICERALTIAYTDECLDFPAKRDKLAQKLFAPEKLSIRDCGTDASLLPLSSSSSDSTKAPSQADEGAHLSANNSTKNPHHPHHRHHHHCKSEEDVNSDEEYQLGAPDRSYDEAEALTEEIEQEMLIKTSVMRIKETLDSHEMQSEKELLESLERLNLMDLSVEILKDTEIGRSVSCLRKNPSKQVKLIAKRLVRDWKNVVDDWVRSVEDVAKATFTGTPASGSPDDVADEHGLPSPPMDEAALLGTQTCPMEISQILDFMDDDPRLGNNDNPIKKSPGMSRATQKAGTESESKLNKAPLVKEEGNNPGHKMGIHSDKVTAVKPKASVPSPTSKDDNYSEKLLASKRKLQQNYHQAETGLPSELLAQLTLTSTLNLVSSSAFFFSSPPTPLEKMIAKSSDLLPKKKGMLEELTIIKLDFLFFEYFRVYFCYF